MKKKISQDIRFVMFIGSMSLQQILHVFCKIQQIGTQMLLFETFQRSSIYKRHALHYQGR